MAGAVFVLCAGSAGAGTLSYQEGDGKGVVSQTDDATLDAAQSSANLGGLQTCQIDLSDHKHCVLKFPNVFGGGVNQIPPGSQILNATLTVFVGNAGVDCPMVYQLTEDWTESEVTWNSRAISFPWASPGAEGLSSRKALDEGPLPCSAGLGPENVDVARSVQNWSNGEPNEGWVFVNANNNDGVEFRTSEHANLADRPQLTISFVPTVFYSVGIFTGNLETGSPTIVVSGTTATLDVAQLGDMGVGDVIDYDSDNKLAYIAAVVSPTQFEVLSADGSAPIPVPGAAVNSIKRAFSSIGAAIALSSDAFHLGTNDLASNFQKLHWVLYDDGPFDIFATESITGYTTALDYNITLTVAGASQVASGKSQRHTGVEGTGARLDMQTSAQYVLDVDVPYTRINWLEIDGNTIPMVGGILVKPNGDETILRNLIIHGTSGNSFTGSAVYVTSGADDVEMYNLVAYDFGGDGVYMEGAFGKVANGTFYLGQNGGASSSIRTGSTGSTSGYSVLAVGPGASFREDSPGGLSLFNSISTDTSACDFDFSGSCQTNVSPVSEFASLGSPVDLHLIPGAAALDFGFDLGGIFDDDIDGQIRPLGPDWDTGADEAPVFSGTTNYRSIGTASPYGTGRVNVVNGSDVVTGSGAWISANRGRGDVITIPCPDFPTCAAGTDYTILAVDSETSLRITQPYAGPTVSLEFYRIDRQFDTLQEWEDCISTGGSCVYFLTGGGDLQGDDRSEVGIAYADSIFTLASADLQFDGATTDALHTITLTADGVNRHGGVASGGVIVDGQSTGNAIIVRDDHVTIEWLEIIRVRGSNDLASILVEDGAQTSLLFRNLLIHDFFDGGGVAGISLTNLGPGNRSVTIRNVMIWDGDEEGIQGGRSSDTVRIENCSIDDMRFSGSAGIDAADSVVTVINTIVMRSGVLDYDPDNGSFSPASTNNISGDGSAPGTNALPGLAPGAVFAIPGVDLRLRAGGNVAVDSGVNLFPTSGFQNDVEDELRPVGSAWDRGADERSTGGLDLAITKDDGQTTAVPGTPISYTITVTNNGPDPVTGVNVADPVPAQILGPFFSTSNGVYSSGTGDWVFAAPLFVGQSTILTLNGTIDPAATGTLTNTATVTPPPGFTDTNSGNDSDSDIDNLSVEADLEIIKTGDLDPIEVGNLLTYTLTVVNNGPSDATGVTVTDILALELEYQSDAPSQGGCSYAVPTRTLNCNLGPIAASGSANIVLVVRTTAVATVSNTAAVTGNEPDPVAGNNSSTLLTVVTTATDGVRFFTVTSTDQRNVLEWLNPGGAAYSSTEILYRTDRFPNNPGDGTSIYNAGTGGLKDRFVHATPALTNNQTYYYAAFVHRTVVPLVSAGRFCTGRPFDISGPVKWAFSTGAFSITPPTVSAAGVVAPANDGALYAMERGDGLLGGEWPAGWHPAQLGGVVQSRSPVIPLPAGGANPVVYLGAQDGNIYSVDGTLGGAPAPFPWAPRSIGGMVQAAPAGLFTNWGGVYSYLLVGTRDDGLDNKVVALNPDTPGNIIAAFDNMPNPGIGIITGMATVDYATNRLYFTSHQNTTGSNSTLWCLQLDTPSPGPVFTKVWERALGSIAGSPVVQGGRVYVGSTNGGGTVYSINATTGAIGDDRTFVHGDGPVKGFVWPDRDSTDLYFATTNRVWGISDTGAPTMPEKFTPTGGILLGGGVATPSTLLFVPGDHFVYVGGSDGQLYELDVLFATPTQKQVPLGDGLALVGAPSLDWAFDLIHVGTEAGIFYAVKVPLLP